MRMRGTGAGVAAAAMIAVGVAVGPAAAEVHVVQPGESIQAAIDVAASGDVIFVMPGEYAEHLEIVDKVVSLRSVGGAEATRVVLAYEPMVSPYGIVVGGDAGGTWIDGFTFPRVPVGVPLAGIGVHVEADLTVSNCVFEQFPGRAIETAAGVPGLEVTVRETRFVGCPQAIVAEADLHVEGCSFIGSQRAVTSPSVLCTAHVATISECYFEDGVTAIELSGAEITVDDCVFEDWFFPLHARCEALAVRRSSFVDFRDTAIQSRGATVLEDLVVTGPGARRAHAIAIQASTSPVALRRCYVDGATSVSILAGGEAEVSDSHFANCAPIQAVLSIRNTNAAAATLVRGCSFVDNSGSSIFRADSAGGRVTVTDCRMMNNEGEVLFVGGAGSGSSIERCALVDNFGGRGSWFYAPGVAVTRCEFKRNGNLQETNMVGGSFTSCRFLGNIGRIALLRCSEMTNCLLVGNRGRVLATGGVTNVIAGSTFASNSDLTIGAAALVGSVVRGNTPPAGAALVAASASFSNIPGGHSGGNNIDADPRFVLEPRAGPDGQWGTADDFYGDLRLRPGSPCIDAGSTLAFPDEITTDLAGNPRFVDDPATMNTGLGDQMRAMVDMGAYEFQPGAPLPCPCDYDGSGGIEQTDLLLYIGLWFEAAAAADVDRDGVVDVFDLIEFLDCFIPGAC